MNSEKVETWHGIIISPTQHVIKSREGYGKNWMNFVYKMNNLYRSVRVSDENPSVKKAFHFLSYFNSRLFVPSICTIRSHAINFKTFLTWFAIFHAFNDLFWTKMTMKLKSTANELWNGWKLAWYHHFTHIACAKKLRGLRQKLDALRVENEQSLSKYEGFRRKLICYKRISIF